MIPHSTEAVQRLANLGFHGTYMPNDVVFLLKKLNLKATANAEKERLIQSGQKHYSQMIGVENAPSDKHMQLYAQALAEGGQRFARDTLTLAHNLLGKTPQPIVLVSLVRAGVPLGVCLKHAIEDLGRACYHYGISIIRDRGIDRAALEAIIQTHGADSIVFVDGWTGKGAISKELNRNILPDTRFALGDADMAPLVTLADVGGCAWLAASGDDWLIPSGILGSVVSGLISRSILQEDVNEQLAVSDCFNPEHWHGCIVYGELADYDISRDFVAQIDMLRKNIMHDTQTNAPFEQQWSADIRLQQNKQILQVIADIKHIRHISNDNRIKTGIAEATRAVMRRVPELILLREADNPDTRLLRHLAAQTGTPIEVVGQSIAPYHAITLIQRLGEPS